MLHEPAGRVSSSGQDAVELAAASGLFLDDWQAWCLDQMLGEDDLGRWVASVVLLILPRQNGKNAVLEALELYAFYVLDESRILHTAHLAKTAADHMRRMVELIRANEDLDAITRVYWSNGKEAIERTDTGARLEFITRGRKTARGGSPKRVVFDEALFLTDEQIQSILPALSAQSLNADPPQMVYTSSAPLAESLVLHRLRDRGCAGDAGRMFMAEWSCETGVDIVDPVSLRDALYSSNPGMGVRISEDWVIQNELSTMSIEAFLTERLGVVVPASEVDSKLPADKWKSTVSADLPRTVPMVAVAFDVTKDGEWSSVAWSAGTLQSPYVEVRDHKQGTGWLPAYLVDLVQREKPSVVACNGAGPAGAMVGPILAAFAEAKIPAETLVQMPAREYVQACGGFYTDVIEGRLRRPAGQGPLDAAAADAAERLLGEAWAWDRRSSTVPISPLVAVTIARAFLPTEKTEPLVFAY